MKVMTEFGDERVKTEDKNKKDKRVLLVVYLEFGYEDLDSMHVVMDYIYS